MLEILNKIKTYPKSVKTGIYFMIAAWVGHWIFFCAYFLTRTGKIPGDLLLRHFILGGVICFFLIRQKAWARWLGIMGNLIVLVYYIMWMLAYQMLIVEKATMGFIMILFSISTYQLFRKESSEFFKVEREDQTLKENK